MTRINSDRNTVVGIGSALIDVLIREDDSFLDRCGALKGGMSLVDFDIIQETLAMTTAEPEVMPGGSACNTAIGVAKLGGNARFIGKCGDDDFGRSFEEDLRRNNVEPLLFRSPTPTGRVVSVVTPDAQRSMLTFLGASAETMPEEIGNHCFEGAAVVHIEGYLAFNPSLMQTALQCAKRSGALVSLDLASYTVVEASKDLLDDFIRRYVDILLANEDEARAFTGHTDEMRAAAALKKNVDIAVLKLGERGSWICHDRGIISIDPVRSGDIIDTTGAGDLWAAGFLYAYVNGFPLDRCGALGSLCGHEVCRQMGAGISDEGWMRIHSQWRKP